MRVLCLQGFTASAIVRERLLWRVALCGVDFGERRSKEKKGWWRGGPGVMRGALGAVMAQHYMAAMVAPRGDRPMYAKCRTRMVDALQIY